LSRFAQPQDPVFRELNTSLGFDRRLWPHDVRQSRAHARMLAGAGIISGEDRDALLAALDEVESELAEGRFPFLDNELVRLANSLPPSYKLRVLDEKHVLKRVAEPIVPAEVVTRKKQPFRAPNALCFTADAAPEYIREALSETAIRKANVFDPASVTRLLGKCQARTGDGDLSNADNMALVGVLSTQLLHQQFVASCPSATRVSGTSNTGTPGFAASFFETTTPTAPFSTDD